MFVNKFCFLNIMAQGSVLKIVIDWEKMKEYLFTVQIRSWSSSRGPLTNKSCFGFAIAHTYVRLRPVRDPGVGKRRVDRVEHIKAGWYPVPQVRQTVHFHQFPSDWKIIRSHFHQHFMSATLRRYPCAKRSSNLLKLKKASRKTFVQ